MALVKPVPPPVAIRGSGRSKMGDDGALESCEVGSRVTSASLLTAPGELSAAVYIRIENQMLAIGRNRLASAESVHAANVACRHRLRLSAFEGHSLGIVCVRRHRSNRPISHPGSKPESGRKLR